LERNIIDNFDFLEQIVYLALQFIHQVNTFNVQYENNNDRNSETIFSKRLKAGKLRTYFFDVRSTRSNDFFITLTESKKRFNDGGYDRHKLFLYKEDFNKFLKALTETVDYVKTELMPDFDFDSFNHDQSEYSDQDASAESIEHSYNKSQESPTDFITNPLQDDEPKSADADEVDKW
jgi:hypothetical protein